MERTILVPLDGSPLAEHALPYAEALASASGARLTLFEAAAVHFTPAAALQDFASAMRRAAQVTLSSRLRGEPLEPQHQALREAEEYLGQVQAVVRSRGLEAQVEVVPGGAVETVANEIRMREPSLVVMTTHGRSGLGRWMYGSVAQGVLRRSGAPVVLVQSWLGEHPWRRLTERPALILPLDGSEFAEAALPLAVSLAVTLQGSLRLVQAVHIPEHLVLGDDESEANRLAESMFVAAEQYLAGVQERLAREYPALRVNTAVRRGLPVEALAAATRDESVALVVMSTHGRTGVGRALFGSVADGLLRAGSVPLALVRPAALRREEQPDLAGAATA